MRKTLGLLAMTTVLAMPAVAQAGPTIDASLIPDGTYTVKVEKVVDPKHILVLMDNGAQTTLTAGRPTVDFSKIGANDKIKLSISKGEVLVYLKVS